MSRFRAWRLCAPLLMLSHPLAAPAAETPAPTRAVLEALRGEDMRLARIGERLAIANARLCADAEPRTGIILHDLAQYAPAARPEARGLFGFAAGPIAVEGVVPDSPGAHAGVRPDDVVLSIDGAPIGIAQPDAGAPAGTQRLVEVYRQLGSAAADGALSLGVARDGAERRIAVAPVMACASRFEVVVRNGLDALADGEIVQISARIIETVESDDELAAVVAHELAHNILRHRARLKAAGVDRGPFESLGRNVGYIRRSEIEADMLGIVLLANAGYDIAAPARLWNWFGRKHYNSILLSRTHPRWTTRVKLYEREAARIAPISARPYVPPILAERDKPMSNDWQSLLAGL